MYPWCQRYNPSVHALREQQRIGCRRLRFAPQLERPFRSDLFVKARSARLGLLILLTGLHLITPLYYVRLLDVPQAFVASAYAWQYGLQLPAILAALAAVWLRPSSRANTGLCIFAFLAVVAGMLGQRTMGMAYDFHVPVEFAAIAVAGFMICVRIVFWRALPWAVLAGLAILANELLLVPDSPSATYHTLCALILVAIALFWGYSIELAERDTWLKTRLLDHMARHDGLTGLLNRVALDQVLQIAFDKRIGTPRHITLAMVDIDHFKAYNDSYGHAAGDEAIARVARLCEAAIHPHCGTCARYGGEELILLWLGSGYARACERAQGLQAQLESLHIAHAGSPIGDRLTLSIGLFHIPAERVGAFAQEAADAGKSAGASVIENADRLLYEAKNAGRNRIIAEQCAQLAVRPATTPTHHAERCGQPETETA